MFAYSIYELPLEILFSISQFVLSSLARSTAVLQTDLSASHLSLSPDTQFILYAKASSSHPTVYSEAFGGSTSWNESH